MSAEEKPKKKRKALTEEQKAKERRRRLQRYKTDIAYRERKLEQVKKYKRRRLLIDPMYKEQLRELGSEWMRRKRLDPDFRKRQNEERLEVYNKCREYRIIWLMKKRCVDCGSRSNLEFDHVPERGTKLFNISSYIGPLDKLRAEIVKCDPVCRSCHRKRTASRRNTNPRERSPRTLFD